MVRVISVHHFTNQQILTVEQPTASCVAPPHRLLLALSSHCIEVRDLSADGDVLFTFPTVDEVAQILHCLNGDYVATMESKFNRQNRELNFVRVYINWDNVATLQQSKMNSSGASLGLSECGMVQPMRARIAGRVTPTTNQSELGSLEMIEIPTKRNPTAIQVCQVSGNILIQSNKLLTIYAFEVKTHDISKLKFVDFEEVSISIELTFYPTQMAMCEHYIACLNRDSLHMFKLVHGNAGSSSAREVGNEASGDSLNFKYNDDETIDYKKLLRDESRNPQLHKVTVNLPSILRENSVVHRHSPFTFCDKDLIVKIENRDKQNIVVENLIQLKLKPILIENAQKHISEEFKCLILKPIYVDDAYVKRRNEEKGRFLRSDFRNNLHSVTCLIATQQEGYLYQFCDDADVSVHLDNCITVYPFTAPVHRIVMEDYFLHALTETGLESYTLRTGHRLCMDLQNIDDINVACPPISESVCLVGLRPFLGIEQLLLSNNHLVLLANGEGSPTHSVGSNSSSTTSYWTLYCLELPTPKTVFNDICIVANVHRFTSAQTYRHLICEAHMILRKALILSRWSVMESNVSLLKVDRCSKDDVKEVYRTSCALLADHYIMCLHERDYCMSVPYYKMAGIGPHEIIKRVKKIQEQSNSHQVNGLIYYLKTVLFNSKASSDILGSCSKQNFAEAVLDLFERYNFQELPNLILKVAVLREYSTDKLINILNNGTIITETNQTEKLLALVILYILRTNLRKAHELLQEITRDKLYNVLLDNWELLFESIGSKRGGSLSFSELAVILMNTQPELLADLFMVFVNEKRVINLGKLLKVFLEYLPSSIGNDANQGGLVLQKTLELHFARFFEKYDSKELSKVVYDRASLEAMKLLVRSYLSQIQMLKDKQDSADVELSEETEKIKNRKQKMTDAHLFASLRFEYLNRMPPFNGKVAKNAVLKKLQALLCSQAVPNQVILEVNQFLALNENLRGNMSLQSIIMSVNDGVPYLLENCPGCVLQYGKDRFNKPDDWKFLIATVQRRILMVGQNEEQNQVSAHHKKLLKDILTHVATTLNLEHLIMVFPQHMNYSTSYIEEDTSQDPDEDILNEIQNYDPYITLCKETMHANQIKKLITATGQQLLCTLNL